MVIQRVLHQLWVFPGFLFILYDTFRFYDESSLFAILAVDLILDPEAFLLYYYYRHVYAYTNTFLIDDDR